MAIGCGWSLAASPRALAQARHLNVPAGPVDHAVAILAQQAGISIGAPGGFPKLMTRAVQGRMTAAQALNRLLHGSGYRSVQVATDVWRIEASPRPPRRVRPPPRVEPPPKIVTGDDIIVTASKRGTTLSSAADPVAVLSMRSLADIGDAPDTGDVAGALTGLSVTNLGVGRNRLFIRGVADSPFDGFGQSSASVQVDEARLTYDAPDPDLRLIDMQQVELLKGPQGPLYGTGALGGVYRLVPAKPELETPIASLHIGGTIVQDGASSGSAEAMVNVPIVTDTLGLRAVGYRIGAGGWIETGGARDTNHGQMTGGRIALRARPGGDWTVDLLGLSQSSSVADSQYVERPGTLSRTARLPEPQDTDISLIGLTAAGSIGGLHATIASSVTWQELRATYDASAKAAVFGVAAPVSYVDDRHYRVVSNEARVAGVLGRVEWLAGASFLAASTDATGNLATTTPLPVLRFQRMVIELAGFGEATWQFRPTLRATAGVRVFRSSIEDERRDRIADSAISRATVRASPSATLAWQPNPRLLIFARYASALRPGGIDVTRPSGQTPATYRADELQAYDLGLRWSRPHITLDLGLFASTWAHVQADYLGSDGLVSTRNAGDAENHGVDVSLGWTPTSRLSLSGGMLVQHARIYADSAAGGGADRRLPIVPDFSTNGELAYVVLRAGWRLRASIRASYIDETRLSFDSALARHSDAVTLASIALTGKRVGWTIRAGVDNLANSRADSFAFGNPFSISTTDQHTPVRPRTATLSLRRDF